MKNPTFIARNKSSLFLLVLALIVSGVGAQATGLLNTASGGYLVCVNSATKVVTHPGKSTCPKGYKKLVLGAQGAAGVNGLTGAAGLSGKDGTDGKDGKTLWNGVKDPESSWGAPGDMFINSVTKTLFGPKDLITGWPAGVIMVGATGATGLPGLTGAQGPGGASGGSGPACAAGATGATGATGAAGATGSSGLKITELSICGSGGASLCKVGAIGPGGGIIFFVDYNDQYVGFNYLEAAPASCEALRAWSSVTTWVSSTSGWAGRAVGMGSTNTTAIKAAFPSDDTTNNASYFATNCSAGGKLDWFLGSLGEMKLMYDNLQGVGGFMGYYYLSSTVNDAGYAWNQSFDDGTQGNVGMKGGTFYVRPVRAF